MTKTGKSKRPAPGPLRKWWSGRSPLTRFLILLGAYSVVFYANALYLEQFATPIDVWPYWQINEPVTIPDWYIVIDLVMIFMFFDIIFRFLNLILSVFDRTVTINITLFR